MKPIPWMIHWEHSWWQMLLSESVYTQRNFFYTEPFIPNCFYTNKYFQSSYWCIQSCYFGSFSMIFTLLSTIYFIIYTCAHFFYLSCILPSECVFACVLPTWHFSSVFMDVVCGVCLIYGYIFHLFCCWYYFFSWHFAF